LKEEAKYREESRLLELQPTFKPQLVSKSHHDLSSEFEGAVYDRLIQQGVSIQKEIELAVRYYYIIFIFILFLYLI